MTDLLDVNVLVSLTWPSHVHHVSAQQWFQGRSSDPWATTPFTEAGFVRVSSNSSAIPGAVTIPEALRLLERLRQLPGFVFLRDEVDLLVGRHVDWSRLVSHRQVTDAHLLAVARHHGARLATHDRSILQMAGGTDVVLIQPTS